jgi:hypothetical protein
MPTCSQSARYASPGPKPAPAMPSASIQRSAARAAVRRFGVPFRRPVQCPLPAACVRGTGCAARPASTSRSGGWGEWRQKKAPPEQGQLRRHWEETRHVALPSWRSEALRFITFRRNQQKPHFSGDLSQNLGFYSRERCQNDAPDSQQRRSKSHFLSPQAATLRIRKGGWPRSPQGRPGLVGWPATPGADSLMRFRGRGWGGNTGRNAGL